MGKFSVKLYRCIHITHVKTHKEPYNLAAHTVKMDYKKEKLRAQKKKTYTVKLQLA